MKSALQFDSQCHLQKLCNFQLLAHPKRVTQFTLKVKVGQLEAIVYAKS